MRCSEFLQGYSEFADDRLTPATFATFGEHLEKCPACQRYHRVLREGIAEYRSLPELHPSPDFIPRLQHRLFHVDDAGRLSSGHHLGSAALVAVASVGFLALAWLPFATRMSVEVELPAVAVEIPVSPVDMALDPMPALFREKPFNSPVSEYLVPLEPTLDGPSDFFMGPFGPMVPVTPVTPPPEDTQLDSSLDGSR
jgi:hypothetical protein